MATNPPTGSDGGEGGGGMGDGLLSAAPGLLDRLDGIRRQLIIIAGIVAVVCLACFFLGEPIFKFMLQPLCRAFESIEPPLECKVYPVDLLEPFIVYLKLGILVGIFLSSPLIFYQGWKIVAPALVKRERGLAFVYTAWAAVMFVGGASFGYFVVFPLSFKFLVLLLNPEIGTVLYSMTSYFSFVSLLLIGFGIAFELPLVMTLLSRLGLVQWYQYAKFTKYAIIALLVLSAFLTPQDPGSMILMAAPLSVLYVGGIGLSRLVGRPAPWSMPAPEDPEGGSDESDQGEEW